MKHKNTYSRCVFIRLFKLHCAVCSLSGKVCWENLSKSSVIALHDSLWFRPRVTIATTSKSKMEENMLIWFMLRHRCLLLQKLWTGTQRNRIGIWRQETMQRPWRSVAYWHTPSACSVCFLKERRTTCPGTAPPAMDWVLSQQSLIKKMFVRLAFSLILLCHYLNWESILSDNSVLSYAYVELASTYSWVHVLRYK